MSGEVLYSDVKFPQKNKGRKADDQTSTGKESDVTYAAVKFAEAPSDQQQETATGTADPSVCRVSSCRQVALVVTLLCLLLLAAMIFLTFYLVGVLQGVPHCPQEWELSSNKCYYFSNDTMDWNSSHKNCTSMGGHLVIIETVEEQRFLSEKAKQILNNTIPNTKEELSHWIGLTDVVKEGEWLWVDNTTLSSSTEYWATRQHDGGKEPDNYDKLDKSGEDCAHLLPVKNKTLNIWYDASCSSHYKRICETMPHLG
ncbi:C-type lectin domain family 4 member E-like isoform X2 [Acipenser oxyrinchus oxyrinchus]|uniref:C-type lectin domain family 4 member E-like isoform X2 n=1 Tax=Acipenser oxyrinchus oxyrinchus TaxID=40147 RepID=A0AAD8FXC6_ACIOX|nr:C-type lectin domain family 4 member E-like isoform X2 [Acipenser oxyrinchus oxyrinchus]